MNMLWRQLAAPRGSIENSPTSDIGFSLLDDRTVNGVANPNLQYPSVVYGIREGSNTGVKVFKVEELQTAAGCPTPGSGEEIPNPHYVQAITHNEFELGLGAGLCNISVDCGDPVHPNTSARVLYNNRCDFIKVRSSSGRYDRAVVVAAGFPTAIPDPTQPGSVCDWTQYNGRPMIVIFKVNGTGDGSFQAPQLWLIGLGSGLGDAFAVKVRKYQTDAGTKYYAFVGDITGRLLVFDISSLQYTPTATIPYLGANHILAPVAPDLVFPKDPYDGFLPNVIDMYIEGDFLYCALARAGVAIVNIADPQNPVLCDIMDTPGLALGLTFRTLPSGARQMIVGDSRCGIRVYQ
jgi:hypothetical protein